jgi:hypothetical protein
VDVCLLLSCSNSSRDIEELVRRVTARGRENPSFAESRVRKHFSDSIRAWAIVNALPQWLRGSLVEVNGMQVDEPLDCSCLDSAFLPEFVDVEQNRKQIQVVYNLCAGSRCRVTASGACAAASSHGATLSRTDATLPAAT